MGTYHLGPFSGFSGKVGNLVGSSWRDKEVLRGRPRPKKNRKMTAEQEDQQAKFSLASKLTTHLSRLIKTSYGKAGAKTSHNVAYQEILNKVITGVSPNLVIDYSKLPVARGKNAPALNPVAESIQQGKVKFTWGDNIQSQEATADDTTILVVYCEEMEELLFQLNGATRSALEDEMDVSFLAGKQVHTWISFITPDKVHAAKSMYAGLVTVL